MTQNLISATLPAEDAADIMKSLAMIKTKLSFLSKLQTEDVSGLFNAGNAFLPFIDLAHEALEAHPEIFPAVFDKEEFERDYNLMNTLRPILTHINELAESLQKTYIAAASDSVVEALEIYGNIKANKDKVPGLSVIADKMFVFFKKNKSKNNSESKKA